LKLGGFSEHSHSPKFASRKTKLKKLQLFPKVLENVKLILNPALDHSSPSAASSIGQKFIPWLRLLGHTIDPNLPLKRRVEAE
jgi:hypothetical protein